MTEMDLLNILEDLNDEEFKKFKWSLKYEKVGDIPPIKQSQLCEAKRQDVVDLMVQNYKLSGAVEVIKNILKMIRRNDLVGNISSGAEGQSQEETNMTSHPDSRSVRRNNLFLYIFHKFRLCASAHSI